MMGVETMIMTMKKIERFRIVRPEIEASCKYRFLAVPYFWFVYLFRIKKHHCTVKILGKKHTMIIVPKVRVGDWNAEQ